MLSCLYLQNKPLLLFGWHCTLKLLSFCVTHLGQIKCPNLLDNSQCPFPFQLASGKQIRNFILIYLDCNHLSLHSFITNVVEDNAEWKQPENKSALKTDLYWVVFHPLQGVNKLNRKIIFSKPSDLSSLRYWVFSILFRRSTQNGVFLPVLLENDCMRATAKLFQGLISTFTATVSIPPLW